MVVLVDILERHRLRCQVELVASTSDRAFKRGNLLEYRVIVKRASEYVSLDKLAYMLGHASAFRRLMFSLMEHEDDDIRKTFGLGRDTKGGYGFPGTTDDRGDLYLDKITSDVDWTPELTMLWLKRNLVEQGIKLEEV